MTAPPPLPFARLGLIDDPIPRAGALNMAIDETLLGGLGGEPLLRIYRWARPTVSIGYFDAAQPVADRWPGREVVRRWTGGGVVEHGHDLTFSLFVPRAMPLAAMPAAESYRFIHLAVAAALAGTGDSTPTLHGMASASAAPSRACFENPVTHDLMAAGQKIAGGAQRRTRRGLLHQGSIRSGEADPLVWIDALAGALPGAFCLAIEPRPLSTDELTAAVTLAVVKYGAPGWLQRF